MSARPCYYPTARRVPTQPRAAAIIAYVMAHQERIEQTGPGKLEISWGAGTEGELAFWLSELEKRRPCPTSDA